MWVWFSFINQWATPTPVNRTNIKLKCHWLDSVRLHSQAIDRSTMYVLGGTTRTTVLIWIQFVQLCVLGAKFCLITRPTSQCKLCKICRVDASRFRIAKRTLPAIGHDMFRGVRKIVDISGIKRATRRAQFIEHMPCDNTDGHLFRREK
jgi:hypothetical protein